MKRLLMGVSIVALALAGFVPATQATGYTTSGQQSGSEHCSGGQAALDTGAAVGVVDAGESDWYSVTSDQPVMIRWRPASGQFVTGISEITAYSWNQHAGPGEIECQLLAWADNFPIDGAPPFVKPFIELGPFPAGQYQIEVNAWDTEAPAQAYVLTSTPE